MSKVIVEENKIKTIVGETSVIVTPTEIKNKADRIVKGTISTRKINVINSNH